MFLTKKIQSQLIRKVAIEYDKKEKLENYKLSPAQLYRLASKLTDKSNLVYSNQTFYIIDLVANITMNPKLLADKMKVMEIPNYLDDKMIDLLYSLEDELVVYKLYEILTYKEVPEVKALCLIETSSHNYYSFFYIVATNY